MCPALRPGADGAALLVRRLVLSVVDPVKAERDRGRGEIGVEAASVKEVVDVVGAALVILDGAERGCGDDTRLEGGAARGRVERRKLGLRRVDVAGGGGRGGAQPRRQ